MTDGHDAGPPPLSTERAHSARVYDYFLGGKDNYEIDRTTGDALLSAFPSAPTTARVNRAFMHRAARALADRGMRQFLDIGTGIPTEPNLHQIVQAQAPEARVLYVDSDPIVLAHAAALMTSDPRGRTAFLLADATGVDAVLGSPTLREVLDLDRPVGLSLISVLHFFPDDAAAGLVRALLDAVPSGSHLAITHGTVDNDPAAMTHYAELAAAAGTRLYLRGPAEIQTLFLDGLELLEPGIVPAHRWRADDTVGDVPDRDVAAYAAVALKKGMA